MSFFANGSHEKTKAVVHGALGGLALACGGYNVVAYVKRGNGHLLRNAVVYSALAIYEALKVQKHLCER